GTDGLRVVERLQGTAWRTRSRNEADGRPTARRVGGSMRGVEPWAGWISCTGRDIAFLIGCHLDPESVRAVRCAWTNPRVPSSLPPNRGAAWAGASRLFCPGP